MNHQTAQKTERLTDAFQLFNQLSQNLSESYQGLEEQVTKLTEELAAARSERVNTLIEKERLATRLQQILTALPAAVIILNDQEQIIDCNDCAIHFLGEPLIGLSWKQVLQHKLLPVLSCPHERQLQNGQRVSIIRNFLANDSEQIILLSDISELRSLQDMVAQQKQLSAMGKMVADLAHQVRTPLATAILYASQLNKPNIAHDKRRQFSARILERLHHLERQVNDMLIFAKQGRMSMETFSLTDLLIHIKENMEEFDVNFQLQCQVQIDIMRGNEDALRGALMNLLLNAVEAVKDPGQINMKLSQQQTSIKISIKDNGPGIEKQQQQKLFEPFYTTKVNGNGLGLAVVDSVIKAHGGTIQCTSEPGKGTEFTLILPCFNQYSLSLSQATDRVDNQLESQEKTYETA